MNLCYDKIKSGKYDNRNRQHNIDSSLILNLPAEENPEDSLMNNELAHLIQDLTDHLTPKQKLVFTLVEIEELTHQEVAEITGLSLEKIKSNLYCARQNIRKKLDCMDISKNEYVR